MFDRNVDYPCAVASNDAEGLSAAITWCRERLEDGGTLTVWTGLQSNLDNNPQLQQLVNRYSDVGHVTGRGGSYLRGTGPVLMAWPDMADIGNLLQHGSNRIQALCVITWNADEIRPWVTAASPSILGDDSAWEQLTPGLDPVVVEALKHLTAMINHNNNISAGYEKDIVVSSLLALHEAAVWMDGEAMQGWALAHGWSGQNPGQLAKYVEDINAGRRPRCRRVLRPDYVDILRGQVADTP